MSSATMAWPHSGHMLAVWRQRGAYQSQHTFLHSQAEPQQNNNITTAPIALQEQPRDPTQVAKTQLAPALNNPFLLQYCHPQHATAEGIVLLACR